MASGDTLGRYFPNDNEPPSSNGATDDRRNQHSVLDFDDTTKEAAVFKDIMPQAYGGGGVTVYIHYALTSAETGDTDWDVSFERVSDSVQDIDSDGFAAVQSVDTTTVPGTSGHVDIVNIAFTDGAQMDSVGAGDGFRIKVERDSPNDSASGDAELWGIEIRES